MEVLDAVDKKIISILDQNSRASYSEIGKRTRIAKETVKYRIENLIRRKVIGGFYSVIDYAKFGFTPFRLYLRLENADPKKEEEMLDYLARTGNVWMIFKTDGAFHFAIGIWARDVWEYEVFWNEFRGRYGQFFRDYHLSILTSYSEFTHNYIYPGTEKTAFRVFAKTGIEKLDKTDYAMLSLLSKDARISLVSMAKKLGVSIVTARVRMAKLIRKKIIVGFRPIINSEALGHQYYKVDLWLRSYRKTREIESFILSQPNVTYTEKTLITSDIEFDLEVSGFAEFNTIMSRIKSRFPDEIRDYRYYSRVQAIKTNYMPFVEI